MDWWVWLVIGLVILIILIVIFYKFVIKGKNKINPHQQTAEQEGFYVEPECDKPQTNPRDKEYCESIL